MCFAPVCKRPVAFALDCGVRRGDLTVRDNLGEHDPGHEGGLAQMVDDDLDIAGSGDSFAIVFVRPYQAGTRTLAPGSYEREQRFGERG